MTTAVLSYGGGWQTVAMCVLVKEGALPKPDLAVIADTGRECRSTWDYLHNVMTPYLAPIGLEIQVAPHTLALADLYAKDGLTLMPAWTRTEDGPSMYGDMLYRDGRLASYCSGTWKRDVIERWLRLMGVVKGECWIGYSTDEKRRVGNDHRPWLHNVYPLIEKRISRQMCGAMIEKAGLPMPKKSRCWMCPHQNEAEWKEVKADPEQWAAAVHVDRQIREMDPEQQGLYLYSGRVPLELANFGGDCGLLPPARECETGHCWT